PTPPVHRLPESAPETVCEIATLPQTALIYRLSGDYNPLHAEPAFARRAGFERPILHGLCSFGIVGHAILKTCCNYQTEGFKSMQARFSAPVFPGETIRIEMWCTGGEVSFQARVVERNVVVLNNGKAEIVV
ncbi:MAG: MaoC family dehydratase, partial [Rhodospirillales bacterium]|nr:MaoC family dehydratase [Rhodospirillales bacterium]